MQSRTRNSKCTTVAAGLKPKNDPNFTAAETEAKKPEGKQPATILQAIFFPPTRTKETTLREQQTRRGLRIPQRETDTERERERGKKKAYQEEKDSFLRRMIITGRRLMLPSSLPGSRHSSCSPQSAISVSLANNNNTHTKHS